MYFCLQTDYFPKISCMGMNVTDEFWKHGARTPDEYILFIITKGTMYLNEKDTDYRLKAGDYLLLQPGFAHFGYEESACSYYYIHFAESMFSVFDCSEYESIESILMNNRALFYKSSPFGYDLYDQSKLFIPKDRTLSPSLLHEIDLCMKEVLRSWEQKNEQYKLFCSCKFIEILTKLSSYFTESLFHDGEHGRFHRNNKKTQEIIDLLHKNYTQKVTGSFIADNMEMNYDYLNRMFKNNLGITIFEYLNIIRINKAKELLMNGSMKAFEIASAVGYCDEYHFSKAFKKSVGISPRQYLLSL